jgi:trans-aconitate methyltransferase
MLTEAQKNLTERAITNVSLVNSNRDEITGQFDLVHSYIVFQHIPSDQGLVIFRDLISKIRPGGIGAIHIVYANQLSRWMRIVYWTRKMIPGVQMLANIARNQPASRPFMEMNSYPLANVFQLLQRNGCHKISVRLSDHSGFLGMMILFQKAELPSM